MSLDPTLTLRLSLSGMVGLPDAHTCHTVYARCLPPRPSLATTRVPRSTRRSWQALDLPVLQAHHDAREVFATQDELGDDFGVVHGPAAVCQPGEYVRQANAGDDVYLCEYEYDTAFRVRC